MSTLPPGFTNPGTMCYLSSVLQSTLYIVAKHGVPSSLSPSTPANHLASILSEMADAVTRPTPHINPTPVFQALATFYTPLSEPIQHDAHECISALLDGWHEGSRRRQRAVSPLMEPPPNPIEHLNHLGMVDWELRKPSKIMRLLYGQFLCQVECKSCKHCSTTFDIFNTLSVTIPPSQPSQQPIPLNLHDCMRFTFAEDLFEDYQCDGCHQHTPARKKMDVWRTPPILIIHLKRFDPMTQQKRVDPILFPWRYPLRHKGKDTTFYRLMSVIHHHGQMDRGHYTSTVLHDKHYYNINDGNILPNPFLVDNNDGNGWVSSTAYILIYEREKKTKFIK